MYSIMLPGLLLLLLLFALRARLLSQWRRHCRRRRNSCERVIVFSRYPTPGTTKTRLIPTLGPEGAARCQRLMTESLLERLLGTKEAADGPLVEMWYSGGTLELMRQWLDRRFCDLRYIPQVPDKDLGVRIASSFAAAFAEGAERVVIVGSDIPGVGHVEMSAAFAALRSSSMVLGPAKDGGYYLVGLAKSAQSSLPGLLTSHSIPWGTGGAREATLQAAAACGLTASVLETALQDVDEAPDLTEVVAQLGVRLEGLHTPSLSVILPTLNDCAGLKACVEAAVCGASGAVEVVVIDGGSEDGTLDLAAKLPLEKWWPPHARMCTGSAVKSRGARLQEGVAKAKGDFIIMLTADTRLPPGYDMQVVKTLDTPGVVAGAFAFDIDALQPGKSRFLKSVEVGDSIFFRWQMTWLRFSTNARARFLEMPSAHQAIFVSRRTLEKAGGVSSSLLREDVDLVRRLQALGEVQTLPLSSGPVVMSVQKWRERGCLREV